MTYGENYVFNIKTDHQDVEEEEEWEEEWKGGEGEEEKGEIGQLLPEERFLTRRLRRLRVQLAVSLGSLSA